MRVGAFQGIGSPTGPLDTLDRSEQNKCWTALVHKVEKLAKQPQKQRRTPQETRSTHRPKEPPRLLITLGVKSDLLHRSYRAETHHQTGKTADWPAWQRSLTPLLEWSANPDPSRFEEHANDWSELLFRLLFDTGAERDELFLTLNGGGLGAHAPPYRSYEVQVQTSHPELLRLPWQLCDWGGYLRNRAGGWCFCTSGGGEALTAGLSSPLRALLVRQEGDEGLLLQQRTRLRALQGLPKEREEQLFPLITLDRDPAAHHFRDREIELLLYHGPGFPDNAATGLPELAQALGRSGRRFRLIALLLTGPRRAAAPSPIELLAEYADFVSVEYAPTEQTDLYTPRWLNHWLRERGSPLRAWTQVLDPEVRRCPAAAAIALHSRPLQWSFTGPSGDIGTELWKLFDRSNLKDSLQAALGTLSSHRSKIKVLALCPFGTQGDHASRFSSQLQHHLETHLPEMSLIAVDPLGFPFDRRNLAAGLDQHLRRHLGNCGSEKGIGDCLEELVPASAMEQRLRPVIWLDWGTFGSTPGLHPALSRKQLKEWLSFCAERLVTYCPPGALVVSVISLETASIDDLTAFFRGVYNSAIAHGNRFRLHEPKALERIMVAHVLRLFTDLPGLIAEDPQLRQQVAEQIVERSKGLFEQAVQLLERGRNQGWENLLRESPGYLQDAHDDDQIL